MKVENLTAGKACAQTGAVVAIGNLDGVHLGHKALLEAAYTRARQQNKSFGVLTFDPHPRRLFRPDDPPFLITPGDLKLDRLRENSVDVVYIAAFTSAFAHLSADDFVQKILMESLGTQDVVIGFDFHFGHERTGDHATLTRAGLNVTRVALLHDAQDLPYSASRVRQAIAMGHMDDANALLGWNFEIRGIVIHGDKRGRTLGYPTANMTLGDSVRPAYGVYAARVQIMGENIWHKAAINIGIRPMFATHEALLEAHLLDFSGDLYGRTLRVQPVKYLRSEMKFDGVDALKEQMARDCAQARQLL